MCVGFCRVDVVPSPKFQLQEVIPADPVEASVKVTVVPSQTVVASAEKSESTVDLYPTVKYRLEKSLNELLVVTLPLVAVPVTVEGTSVHSVPSNIAIVKLLKSVML